MSTPTPPNIEREELRKIYERCDVSNNSVDDPLHFEDFAAAIDTYVEQAVKEAEQRGVEKAAIKIMAAKTEGLFDNGELFIKRAPIEQAVVDLLGFERFKAIQDSLPVATPHQKEEGGE